MWLGNRDKDGYRLLVEEAIMQFPTKTTRQDVAKRKTIKLPAANRWIYFKVQFYVNFSIKQAAETGGFFF